MKTRIIGSILVLIVLAALTVLTSNDADTLATQPPAVSSDNDLKSLKIN